MNENFYTMVTELLKKNNLPPTCMQFELTETSLMTYNTGPFKETINKIHNTGIEISIDDFGTGYSSLIRLKHLPIDVIKIEKMFVQDAVNNQNVAIIVSCLIALGKNLGMKVIAEGIETVEQLEFLTERNCPQGQGYYFSRPLSVEKMEELLKQESKKAGKIKI
jgi:EAL domain-containing protein (putative c-di-GMP-specific phosphodiesterase class I)